MKLLSTASGYIASGLRLVIAPDVVTTPLLGPIVRCCWRQARRCMAFHKSSVRPPSCALFRASSSWGCVTLRSASSSDCPFLLAGSACSTAAQMHALKSTERAHWRKPLVSPLRPLDEPLSIFGGLAGSENNSYARRSLDICMSDCVDATAPPLFKGTSGCRGFTSISGFRHLGHSFLPYLSSHV